MKLNCQSLADFSLDQRVEFAPIVLNRGILLAVGLDADHHLGGRVVPQRRFDRVDGLDRGVDQRRRRARLIGLPCQLVHLGDGNRDADLVDADAVELDQRELDVGFAIPFQTVEIGIESADRIVADRLHGAGAVEQEGDQGAGACLRHNLSSMGEAGLNRIGINIMPMGQARQASIPGFDVRVAVPASVTGLTLAGGAPCLTLFTRASTERP
jgi:hypothetical protein